MSTDEGPIELTGDDIEFLVALLKSATGPLSTQDLIDALRARSERD